MSLNILLCLNVILLFYDGKFLSVDTNAEDMKSKQLEYRLEAGRLVSFIFANFDWIYFALKQNNLFWLPILILHCISDTLFVLLVKQCSIQITFYPLGSSDIFMSSWNWHITLHNIFFIFCFHKEHTAKS